MSSAHLLWCPARHDAYPVVCLLCDVSPFLDMHANSATVNILSHYSMISTTMPASCNASATGSRVSVRSPRCPEQRNTIRFKLGTSSRQ
jgi:hypothetical protein